MLKPIAREKTRITPLGIAAGGGGVVAAIAYAVAIRLMAAEPGSMKQIVLCGLGLLLIAPPLAVAAYAVLRDVRTGALTAAGNFISERRFAAWYMRSFGPVLPMSKTVLGQIDLPYWMLVAPPFVIVGGMAGKFSLDLETANGFFHYSFYVAVTIVLGLIAGVSQAIWT